MRALIPTVSMGVVLILSMTLKPAPKAELIDKRCTANKAQTQLCLVEVISVERSSRGFTWYVKGDSTYEVSSQRAPTNLTGRTLRLSLTPSPIGVIVTDYTVIGRP
jgi:hypothetical protein